MYVLNKHAERVQWRLEISAGLAQILAFPRFLNEAENLESFIVSLFIYFYFFDKYTSKRCCTFSS